MDEVVAPKLRCELLLQLVGVSCPNAERDQGSHVPEDRLSHLLVELPDLLMGQTVLPRLREDLDERQGGEVLELVAIEVEAPSLCLWNVDPFDRGNLELRDEETAQQHLILFANGPLWEVGDQDLPVVKQLAEAHSGARLADDVPHERRAQERSHLVQDGGNRFGTKAKPVGREPALPEVADLRIRELLDDLLSVMCITQQAGDREEPRAAASRRARLLLRRMCAIRGPHDDANGFSNTDMSDAATRCRFSGSTCSNGLSANGHCKSCELK